MSSSQRPLSLDLCSQLPARHTPLLDLIPTRPSVSRNLPTGCPPRRRAQLGICMVSITGCLLRRLQPTTRATPTWIPCTLSTTRHLAHEPVGLVYSCDRHTNFSCTLDFLLFFSVRFVLKIRIPFPVIPLQHAQSAAAMALFSVNGAAFDRSRFYVSPLHLQAF